MQYFKNVILFMMMNHLKTSLNKFHSRNMVIANSCELLCVTLSHSKCIIINHSCCISFLQSLQQVGTVSRTRLTPNHVEMLIILKDNISRIEEFKVITSYEIKNKNVVMRGAVEVIELTGPASEGSGLFCDENGEKLDFQDSSSDSSREDGDIEDLLGLAD